MPNYEVVREYTKSNGEKATIRDTFRDYLTAELFFTMYETDMNRHGVYTAVELNKVKEN